MVKIVSASRRTDIPAFYGDWFMSKLKEGGLIVRHPFNGKETYISLKVEDVACFVFWSKNYAPFISKLEELERLGYPFVMHFTITGLPRYLEEVVPPAEASVEVFRHLSRLFSTGRIMWRYDPVFLGKETDFSFHKENFAGLCRMLEGYTERCYISFVHPYRKVEKRLKKKGIEIMEAGEASCRGLASSLADIAWKHGIEMFACCSSYLVGDKVKKARCVDAELMENLFGIGSGLFRRRPSRPACGCSESVDLGSYGTCRHGCIYCYARGG